MASALETQLHLTQAGLSAYSLFHACIAIVNLRKWEPQTKRAANYSDTAAQELYKTRTTQTAGALALICSFSSAMAIFAKYSQPSALQVAINVLNVLTCYAARVHIGGHWDHKAKVPLADAYNTGINSTLIVKKHLGILALGWLVTTALDARLFLS